MEIRGAGELLGDEQSGHIQELGFDLYMEILERTVAALKAGKTLDFNKPLEAEVEINLRIPAIIPEDYLPDTQARLLLYKRIANAKDGKALKDIRIEMIDRFGLLPDPILHLFEITLLKQAAAPFDIKKIESIGENLNIRFDENPSFDTNKLINLVSKYSYKYQFTGPQTLKIKLNDARPETKFQAIQNFLSGLG